MRFWFRPRRLIVEVHRRIQITHKVGNPNVGVFASVRNTGGRELRVKSIEVLLSRDGKALGRFNAQNYFENLSSQNSVLFVPFTLNPGESWDHGTNLFDPFDRGTETFFREHESALSSDIRQKMHGRAETDKTLVPADPNLVKPFLEVFERLFVWVPGEYVVELIVTAEPGSASFAQKYRFTLYESDSAEPKPYADDFKFGGGLSYNADSHVGIFVPLQQHSG